jgi:AraC-like DNA-binding protein
VTRRNTPRQVPRQRQPELEQEFARSPALGYEAPQDTGLVRCLSHGFPTPLARWHFHDEYELHLITCTSGKAFVGDWIGPFAPGHLVLTGPRLPHNWVSVDVPDGGVAERDLVIQFRHEPIARATEQMPELGAQSHWRRVKGERGMRRLAAFYDYLADLARCTDYRLLSNVQMQGTVDDDAQLDQINVVVNRVTEHLDQPLSLAGLAAELGMSETRFSRFFRRATGNNFTDFVNRVRINRACQLLMESDRLITNICYDVGFNNVANFNRRFLEVKGMTPTEFRRQADRRFGGHA